MVSFIPYCVYSETSMSNPSFTVPILVNAFDKVMDNLQRL